MENSSQYCHSGSIQNYLNSPKMPVKDHLTGLKSTSTSFKPAQQRDKNDYKVKNILGDTKLETMEQIKYVNQMKNMKLMDNKQLSIVSYKSGKQNANINSHHDRQTNSGYSRNALGGFFTS